MSTTATINSSGITSSCNDRTVNNYTTTVNRKCTVHAGHLFSHPLCDNQSLLKRVANVFFHVLTLCFPLVLYHAVSWSYSKITSMAQSKSIQPHSAYGLGALEFARQVLQEHPDIQPMMFYPSSLGPIEKVMKQPINPEIASLATFYYNIALKNFLGLLMQNQNPWGSTEVIDAADICMKMGYAISSFSLDDYKAGVDTPSNACEKRTLANLLMKKDSYLSYTFYYCIFAYQMLRRPIVWTTSSSSPVVKDWHFNANRTSVEHAAPFYQEETIQYSWRRLYNEYCDRLKYYVNETELKHLSGWPVMWPQKDVGIGQFGSQPFYLPIQFLRHQSPFKRYYTGGT